MLGERSCLSLPPSPELLPQAWGQATTGIPPAPTASAPLPCHLAGCVLLGFSHSGDFLISYTSSAVAAADNRDGYHLQVKELLMTRPLRRAYATDLAALTATAMGIPPKPAAAEGR